MQPSEKNKLLTDPQPRPTESNWTHNKEQMFASSGLHYLDTIRTPSFHSSKLKESLPVRWPVRHLTGFRSVAPVPASSRSIVQQVVSPVRHCQFEVVDSFLAVASPQGVRQGGARELTGRRRCLCWYFFCSLQVIVSSLTVHTN